MEPATVVALQYAMISVGSCDGFVSFLAHLSLYLSMIYLSLSFSLPLSYFIDDVMWSVFMCEMCVCVWEMK